uniref:Uncharacterized protein n=1 Tax=Mastacembelus armatus TaxID=205130 RepID=A0A3Q3S346_9TELE
MSDVSFFFPSDFSGFAEMVKNFEEVRKKWLHTELELKKYKELLVKSDVAKAALEVKLKHARNQLDVEMKKRYKIEADYHYLERQMQLVCDILVHDSKSSACLNDEQKSLLATFEHKGNVTLHKSSKRLCVIDESSFLSHSDISYDRTDDDQPLTKPILYRIMPDRLTWSTKYFNGGHFDVTLLASQRMSVTVKMKLCYCCSDQTPLWAPCDDKKLKMEKSSAAGAAPTCRAEKTQKHVFVSKTVIWTETCSPCGKRVRFGKMVVKCRNCRVVAHPECQPKLSDGCLPAIAECASFAPVTHPRVPQLIVDCVTEIERRGLQERGLYRVPGGERMIKELRDGFTQGKTPLMLGKVQDIHVVCGFLKDFLRKLKEPLLTFRLHRTFMEASELTDEDDCSAVLWQAVAELPKANRDTLAFLILHLHKVMKSPQCQMDQNNLARVFGPTIVGHEISEPSPTTIMRDSNTQPKVICRLLSLPEDYWRSILDVPAEHILSSTNKMDIQDTGHGEDIYVT